MPNRVVLRNGEIAALISSPGGAVHRSIARDVNRLRNVAVRECPVDKGGLRANHIITTRRVGNVTVWSVGTRKSYAAAVHEGSKPHWIERRGPLRHPPVQSVVLSVRRTALKGRIRTLKFPSTQGPGGFAYVRRVFHPGYHGNPWLKRSLSIVFGR